MKNEERRGFDWEWFFHYMEHAHIKYSCREIAKQSGASYSSIFRALKGKKIDLHNLIYIIDWLNLDINKFIKNENQI